MNDAESGLLVAALNADSDEDAAASATRKCAEHLRRRELSVAQAMEISRKLVELARQGEPRVRQAVAEAAPYLPKGAFEQIITALAKDRSPYVRNEIGRAQERRAALERAAVPDEEHDRRVDGWYAALKKRGYDVWRVAQRISAHEVEYYVRRLCHELGNTLFALEGALKNLDDELEARVLDPDRLREHARRVRQHVKQVRHLLKDAREHATPIEPEFRRENLRAMLGDVVTAMVSAFPDRATRIAVDLGGVDPRLAADVDANFLRQALTNIVKNAIEAYDGRSDGPIDLCVTTKLVSAETQVAIGVADRGCGMDADSVRQAFVPFGSSKTGGTGFGLFISRKVARQYHGGDLALASTPGAGTTVTMTLPLRQETKSKRR